MRHTPQNVPQDVVLEWLEAITSAALCEAQGKRCTPQNMGWNFDIWNFASEECREKDGLREPKWVEIFQYFLFILLLLDVYLVFESRDKPNI